MSRSRPLLALLAAASAVLLALPAGAQANACQTERAHTHPKRAPGSQAPPLFIGDSTGIFAAPLLAHRGVEADAHTCRQVSEGLAIMRRRKAHHTLPRVVVFHLGANAPVTTGQIRTAMGIVTKRRVLVLVTHRVPGGGHGSDYATERRLARQHPQRIRLLDWVRYASGHGSWFGPDGLHPNSTGAARFAAFVAGPARRFNTPWGTSVPRS